MRVLAFGTYDAAAHPRVAVLVEGLRAHGVTVDECNVPLGVPTSARVAAVRSPLRALGPALRLLRAWVLLVARRPRLGRYDAVLVGYLGHFDVHLAKLLFPGVPIVLDHLVSASGTARDRGATGGRVLRALDAVDRAAVGRADLVLVDTAEHADQLPPPARDRVVVPVGAGAEWLAAGAARRCDAGGAAEGPLRVVFFGLFTPLQGAVTIGQAVGLLPAGAAVDVTMVGAGQDLDVARAAAGSSARVRWLGWVPPGALPALVAGHDVCLGIVGTTPKAMRVVPTKVYQGAAAGCAVVTSDTPPQRRMLGTAAVLVPPGDPAALAAALSELAADRPRVERLGHAARDLAERSFGPAAVVAPLVGWLAGRVPAPAGRVA